MQNTETQPSFGQKLARFFSLYWLPILSGILIGTSYIPFPPWALFFCLIPLFLFWSRVQTPRQAFIGGWLTQFILNLIGFHWIAYTAVEFGHFPWWAGLATLIGFAAIAHLYYALSGWVSQKLVTRFGLQRSARVFTFAFMFLLFDRLFPSIFPWHLGYPWLWANFPGAQFTDVIGFEGLNVVTVVVNALLALSIMEGIFLKGAHPRSWRFATAAVALLGLVNFLGVGREKPWSQTDAELKVLAVQGNIGNFEKLMSERGRDFGMPVVTKYLEMTKQGLAKHPDTQAIIWPETAFPDVLDPLYLGYPLASMVRSMVQETQIPLLTGSYSRESKKNAFYNAFFLLGPRQTAVVPPYRKSILLVFGETFPFSEYIPYMDKLFPNQGSFDRGAGPSALTLVTANGPVVIGPQICYEGLYPWFSAGLAKQGVQIITNVTNDSWFGHTFEAQQHLYMTLARALEFRRPLLRSTNTGVTTAILANGEILEKSPLAQEWVGLYRIPYHNNPAHTFYEKYGALWPWVLVTALVLLVVFGRERKQQQRTRST